MANIMVVEDYPDNLVLMTYILSAAGHEVRGAETGGRAIDLAREDRPDLVILDIQLPDMDGHQVLTALRADEAMNRVPIVAVTAYAPHLGADHRELPDHPPCRPTRRRGSDSMTRDGSVR